jgi:lysophospholipase L1-like esterase
MMSSKRFAAAVLAAMVGLAPLTAVGEPRAAPGVIYATNPGIADQKRPDPHRFDKRVDAYLEADKQQAPAACSVLFIGSASIVAWRSIHEDMAPDPVISRGLGGSTTEDQIFFFDKIVAPYRPRAIFIYVGENDVVNGLTPQEVLVDFKTFMDLKTKELGATPVYFIPAKASPARLAFAKNEQAANDLVEAYAKTRKDLHYIDSAHDAWEGGKILGVLKPVYVHDGIHMNADGYAGWTRIIKPYVDKEAARKTSCGA